MEEVAVLVSKQRRCTEVSGSIRSLRLEGNGVSFVESKLYVAVEEKRVGVLSKAYVGVTHRLQSCKVVVSALQVVGTERLSRLHGSVEIKLACAQTQARVSQTRIGYVAHGIPWMQRRLQRVCGTERRNLHGYINIAAVSHGVDVERDVVFVEFVITIVQQIGGKPLAQIVQTVYREAFSCLV